ncbi:MAG: NADP-dependent oxidoreductase, partial [Steroidobacteraceae bacterium]|nr:NADP-dependent oxidoreductase [Steroidobacteraceae bacterium]
MINRQWVLARRPIGRGVEQDDFRLVETPVPALRDGEFLIRTRYLGVAPVMRSYMLNTAKFERPLAIGDVMLGRGVGEVVDSRHPEYRVGDIVHGKLGWQDYCISDGSPDELMFKMRERGVPISTALGVLGITGFSAYLGLVDIGGVRSGDRVLVSGAAGGVGSCVGQIARNLGAHPVGIVGGAVKCALLTERLGYESAVDYRAPDFERSLAAACPDGIDVFFDNVGGAILDAGLAHLRRHARVVLCGAISQYIDGELQPYPLRNGYAIFRQVARMQAFFIYELASEFARAEA